MPPLLDPFWEVWRDPDFEPDPADPLAPPRLPPDFDPDLPSLFALPRFGRSLSARRRVGAAGAAASAFSTWRKISHCWPIVHRFVATQ